MAVTEAIPTRQIADAAETPRPRMDSRHKLILVILLGAQFMLAVDFSILNVALPAIGKGLGFAIGNLQWVATAFALPAAGFTLLFGRIADLFGRRRLFLTGMALLAGASMIGGLAVSPAMLLTGRVIQGLATALVTPAAMSLLTTSFPEGPLRDRALGLNGSLLSAGFTTGAVFGGLLTDLLSWRWAFFINVPIGVIVLIVTPILVKESRTEHASKLDLPGAATVSGGLLALVYGIAEAGQRGWGSAVVLGSLAVGAVLLVTFWFVELHAAQPLASVRIMRRSTIKWGNLAGLVTFAMGSALIFLITVYLQKVLGYSALATGLVFGVLGVVAFVSGLLAPRVIGRFGTKASLVGGLVVQAAGTLPLLLLGTGRTSGVILALGVIAIAMVGHLTAIVSFMVTATSGLPNEEQGLATGITSMTQQVGLTVGIPVLSSVATSRINALHGTRSAGAAILSGIHVALVVNTALVLAGALLVAVFLRSTTAGKQVG